uniref:Cytochrome P450 n=1 Tax=Emiliania huxleyi TaxID=2903 RepID=A0A7S3TNL6_EMIHU
MVAIFSKIIANRRSGAVQSDDFLQKIIDFRYKDEVDGSGKVVKEGRGFTDSEVTGWLIVLLFAGQHTSSITATWLGAMLLSNKEAMADCLAEQRARVPDEASLTYANLLGMDCMRRAITETLRLYPPLILLMRQVMPDAGLQVGEHTIPKGDVVGLCAPASNLDPRYWPDATAFRPSRYLPDASNEAMFDSRSVGHGMMQGFLLSWNGLIEVLGRGESRPSLRMR